MIDNDLDMGRRRSLRLAGFDYSNPGMYFVTVCTDGKVNLFGEIHGGEMRRNAAGDAVVNAWVAIPERFAAVQLDSFVVMPNHFHGVIFITSGGIGAAGIAKTSSKDADEGAASSARTKSKSEDPGKGATSRPNAILNSKDAGEGAASSARTKSTSKDPEEGAAGSARTRPTLGKIMRAFKSISAIRVNEILGRTGQPVWHRNYFEHIMRRGKDLEEIRRYIAENPARWGEDEENPENT